MLLTEYTTLAEVARGLSFVDKYWDSARVVQNRGVLYGSPTVDRGVTLNGVDQYVKHLLIGNEFDSDEISIVMPFWPEFEADDGVAHTLFDASLSGADDYFVQKTGTNVLRVDLGNTKIRDIALNIFQPYWSVRKLNLLVVSGTSGDNNVWLISDLGVGQMLSSGGVAWSPTAPLDMWVGSIDTGASLFAGKIGEVKIFRNTLIEQEAIDFYNGTTYCYMDQVSVHLPMRACQHDPSHSDGINLITNGDFTAWTADDPDGWTVTESGGNIATQVGNACRIVSDGTIVQISQTILTAGKIYKYSIDYTAMPNPSSILAGATTMASFATTGSFEGVFVADGTSFIIKRSGVSDFTFTNIVVEEAGRTLDVSGNGVNAGLSGPAKHPKRGYIFDGVNDSFDNLPALSGNYTVGFLADNVANFYNTDTVYNSLRTPGGFAGLAQELFVVPLLMTPIQQFDAKFRMQREAGLV